MVTQKNNPIKTGGSSENKILRSVLFKSPVQILNVLVLILLETVNSIKDTRIAFM